VGSPVVGAATVAANATTWVAFEVAAPATDGEAAHEAVLGSGDHRADALTVRHDDPVSTATTARETSTGTERGTTSTGTVAVADGSTGGETRGRVGTTTPISRGAGPGFDVGLALGAVLAVAAVIARRDDAGR